MLLSGPTPTGSLVIDAVPWATSPPSRPRAERRRVAAIPVHSLFVDAADGDLSGRHRRTAAGVADAADYAFKIETGTSTVAPVIRFRALTPDEYFEQYLAAPTASTPEPGIVPAELVPATPTPASPVAPQDAWGGEAMNLSLLRIVVGLVVWTSLIALPATASAQAEDEPFRRGLVARGDKKWTEVVEAMRQAITINRTESTRKVQVRSRLLFGTGTEYLPHYFLGEALKNVGDCAGAVAAWETSEDQKTGHSASRNSPRVCARATRNAAPKGVLLRDEYRRQVSATEQVYSDALGMATRIDRVRGASPDLWRPDVEAEFERARNDLGAAQKGLVKGTQTRLLADFTESKNASARATTALRPLESRLGAAINTRTLIAQQSTETQQVLVGAETSDKAVDAAKIAIPPALATSRDSARALIARARERLALAEKTQNATNAGEALRMAHEASDAIGKVLEQVNKLARGEFELRLQQAVAAASEQFSFVGNSFATLERLVAEKPGMMLPAMSSERAALVKEQSGLQRRFDNARRTENLTGIQDAMRLALEARTRIDALIKAFGPATLA